MQWGVLEKLITKPGLRTSSCGRLFDAVSSICGISQETSYEGESAMLLEAAAHLRNSAPQVLFLLVGEGAEKDRMIALVTSRGLTNIRFVDQQPRETIPAYIRLSDVCLVLLKKTDLFKTVIPTKMLEFMSCARPIILGVDGQARKIMDQAGAGVYVEPENVAALVQVITRLAANPVLRETLGRNGRRHIVEHFTRQQTASAYIGVLERVVKRDRSSIAA